MAQESSTETPQNDIEQLSEQIAALREDISAITKSLGERSGTHDDTTLDGARHRAKELHGAGKKQLRAAQRHAEEVGQQAADSVKDRPAAAVGLAVGLGFLLGFMTGRK